jgi:uncharacterized repeat protein (TIGR02543 family)
MVYAFFFIHFFPKTLKNKLIMRRKFFKPIRTLLAGATLPLLGAAVMTAAPQLTSAQPIDPERILYYIDFATIPTPTTWKESQTDHMDSGSSGTTNQLLDMDGVIIGVGSNKCRILSNRAGSNSNGNNLVPAPSKGLLMFVPKAANNNQAGAPYVTLPTVKSSVDEIVAYIRAQGDSPFQAAFELLDPAVDTVLENSGLLEPIANTANAVRVSYKLQNSFDSVKVRMKMVSTNTTNSKNGWISDIWVLSAPLPPTGISIAPSEQRIALNSSCEITAMVENYPYADQTTTWSLQTAADSAKATIASSGASTATLTGTAVGTVTVVGTTVNGLSATTTVEVAEIPNATRISITPEDDSKEFAVGGAYKLTTATEPELAIQTATWEVLDPNVVSLEVDTFNAATLTGLAVGTARVVAKSATPEVTDTVSVEVKEIYLDSIAITGSKVAYVNSSSLTLSAQTFPAKAGNHAVTWSSSNSTVAAIDATTGLVTAGAELGTVTITATAADGGGATANHTLRIANAYVDSMNAPNATVGKSLTSSSGGGGFTTGFERKDPLVLDDSLFFANANASSGRRGVVYLFDTPVSFAKKAVVEFDWRVGTYGGADADEGQVSFRSGDSAKNDIFTLYVRGRERSSGQRISFAVGPVSNFTGSNYNDRKVEGTNGVATVNRVSFDDAPTAGAWYHVVVNIFVGQRATVSVTSHDSVFNGQQYVNQATVFAPAGWNPTSISNILVNMTRGSNITWSTALDNLSIRIADGENIPPTGISLSSQYAATGHGGGTNAIAAVVDPDDATDATVTWTLRNAADSAAATIAVDPLNSWKATLTGVSDATVGIVGTTVNGISETLLMEIKEVLLDSVAISGDTLVYVNNTITLSKATWPGNAGNSSVTWSSSDSTIATVNAGTGAVTGVSVGAVTITATSNDGSNKTATYRVTVEFSPITRIALHGARRVFYTANPSSVTPFTVTPVFSPSTASVKALTWGTTDANIVEVNSDGTVVTLKGGYGKAAVTATSTDGSGVVGYYYVEVVAANPYDKFSDLEAELDVFYLTPTNSGHSNGTTTTHEEFQGTKAMKTVASGGGGRDYAAVLKQAVVGDVVNVRFDWYIESNTDGIISIRPDSLGDLNSFGRYKIGSANNDEVNAGVYIAEKNIISVRYSKSERLFKYFTDGYNAPASNDIGASDWPEGDTLKKITNFDTWYTFDVTIDYFRKVITSFTVTERDLLENTATVKNIPLDSLLLTDAAKMRTVKALFVVGQRPGSNNISYTSAFDNYAHKVVVDKYQEVTLTFDPNGGAFGDDLTEPKTVQVISGEPVAEFVPTDVTRESHDFLGWYVGDVPYTEGYTTTEPVTLTAKWQIWSYTVTFGGEGISGIAPVQVDHGGLVTEPTPAPTRSGYLFDGWYNGSTAWNFATSTVTSDLTLTAHWVEDEEEENPTGVEGSALLSLTLYPNPASGSVTLSGLEGGETVDFISLSGTLLLSRKATSNRLTIDVTPIPQGTYIVRVAKGGASRQLKLVK